MTDDWAEALKDADVCRNAKVDLLERQKEPIVVVSTGHGGYGYGGSEAFDDTEDTEGRDPRTLMQKKACSDAIRMSQAAARLIPAPVFVGAGEDVGGGGGAMVIRAHVSSTKASHVHITSQYHTTLTYTGTLDSGNDWPPAPLKGGKSVLLRKSRRLKRKRAGLAVKQGKREPLVRTSAGRCVLRTEGCTYLHSFYGFKQCLTGSHRATLLRG